MFSSSVHPPTSTSTSSSAAPLATPPTSPSTDSPDRPSNEVPNTDKKVSCPSGQSNPPHSSSCSKELPFHIDLSSVHRLIKLHRQESRHDRFVSLALHKRSLRNKRRRRTHKPSFFLKLLLRGRQFIRTICELIKPKLSALVSAIQSKLSSFTKLIKSFSPWQQQQQLLHCSSAIFSLSAPTDPDPGPTRFDTDSILVGADVCASATLCQFKHLFTDLVPVEGMFLKGVAGKIPVGNATTTTTAPLQLSHL